MLDTTLRTEKFNSLLSKLSFLKLKKIWIPIVAILIGITSLYGMNYYEDSNNCRFRMITETYSVVCEKGVHLEFHDYQSPDGTWYRPN